MCTGVVGRDVVFVQLAGEVCCAMEWLAGRLNT